MPPQTLLKIPAAINNIIISCSHYNIFCFIKNLHCMLICVYMHVCVFNSLAVIISGGSSEGST